MHLSQTEHNGLSNLRFPTERNISTRKRERGGGEREREREGGREREREREGKKERGAGDANQRKKPDWVLENFLSVTVRPFFHSIHPFTRKR